MTPHDPFLAQGAKHVNPVLSYYWDRRGGRVAEGTGLLNLLPPPENPVNQGLFGGRLLGVTVGGGHIDIS